MISNSDWRRPRMCINVLYSVNWCACAMHVFARQRRRARDIAENRRRSIWTNQQFNTHGFSGCASRQQTHAAFKCVCLEYSKRHLAFSILSTTSHFRSISSNMIFYVAEYISSTECAWWYTMNKPFLVFRNSTNYNYTIHYYYLFTVILYIVVLVNNVSKYVYITENGKRK